ncbi:hypothetical protein [Georgenia sp. H159]|uniref:hypothetical protein n=1 Tax=Georgenia sp. H159 TaxID=3076115 RepID=UPI002D769091|nr:hypothetical protein [Georgenia sp. H159]
MRVLPPPVECLAAVGVDVDALSEPERARAVEILDEVAQAVLAEAPRATRDAWRTGDAHPLAVRAAVMVAARHFTDGGPRRPGPVLNRREAAFARRVALFGGYLPRA